MSRTRDVEGVAVWTPDRTQEILDSPVETWPWEDLPQAIADMVAQAALLAPRSPTDPMTNRPGARGELLEAALHLQNASRALRRAWGMD